MRAQPDRGDDLTRLYRHRFDEADLAYKAKLWEALCAGYFQRFVRTADTVLDLGAGSCEFINAIRAREKIAVDLNPEVERFAQDARVIVGPADDLPLGDESVDVVFSSNFFEHLPDKTAVLQTLEECRRVLRHGGTLLTMQPNIRYLPGRYWDYFDHHTPLSHESMGEALVLAGFELTKVVPRFLPYTVRSRLPRSTSLVHAYLRLPLLWPLFGRQMLLVARRGG